MKWIISFVIRYIPRKYLQLFSHVILRILALFYQGNKVQCPVCGKQFRKFLPYGRKSRENALCPHCLALERHRLMWLFFQEKTDFFSAPQKVLHIAPEHCFISRFKKMSNLDYTTGDLESPLADIKLDVHQLPFEDKQYDVVLCNHVMEHVEDDHQAMKEIYRVLKPGGWAIMQSPQDMSREDTYEDASITRPEDREKAFRQRDHLRLYGRDYGDRMRSAGFEVEEIPLAQELDANLVQRHALPTNEIIYWAKSGA